MSEITKLYENAGIEKEFEKPAECVKNPYISCDGCMLYDDKKGKCNNRKGYPPFTAEKQLNLIIFLANREIRISPTYISSGYYLNDLHKIKSSRNISNFENSLAQHINAIWQDLTEEEKASIKNILEM